MKNFLGDLNTANKKNLPSDLTDFWLPYRRKVNAQTVTSTVKINVVSMPKIGKRIRLESREPTPPPIKSAEWSHVIAFCDFQPC